MSDAGHSCGTAVTLVRHVVCTVNVAHEVSFADCTSLCLDVVENL
jgi:hypothetical protein